MKTRGTAFVTLIIASGVATPVFAQDQYGGSRQPIHRWTTTPVSPSSGTSTVSPSSVPRAMERMEDPDTTIDLSLGTIYAEGKFGTTSSTTIWSSALGARLRTGNLTVSASLPWMRIRSRSTIYTGIDSTPVLVATDTAAIRRTADGFGDVTLGASYTLASQTSPVELEISGRAKINTATQSGRLSSGENDYALGADVSVPLGRLTPFASVTYRMLGNTASYRLRDGPAASAGTSYALGSASFALLSYHYARAATRLVNDSHEMFAGVSTHVPATPMRLTGFSTIGLSRGAAAVSGGVALSVGLGRRRGR